MTQFLLARLYAPMASWGDITVGERRTSWDRPSRSAILGLIAAALGAKREEQDKHDALDRGYGVAIRVDHAGRPMTDYHTAQSVSESAVKKAKPATRRELLAAGERETILSQRHYRLDALHTLALWAKAEAPYALEALETALQKPHFVLWAGRKANPFGLPLAPQIFESESLAGAFARYAALPDNPAFEDLARIKPSRTPWGREVSRDIDPNVASGFPINRRETRRDASAHRTRWQFAERIVEVGVLAEPALDAKP